MEGTDKQVAFATAVRRSMLAIARRHHPEPADLLPGIGDSTRFLVDGGRPLDGLHWPSPGQLSPTDGESPPRPVGCVVHEKQNATGGTVATANPRWSATCDRPDPDPTPDEEA
jgi:hypothetical protein